MYVWMDVYLGSFNGCFKENMYSFKNTKYKKKNLEEIAEHARKEVPILL